MQSIPELSEIRKHRKKLGISQRELAKHLLISRSMIAKIETEKINPTYRLVQRIFVVLNSLPSVTKGTAGEVAFRPVFAVRETKSVREVVVILQSDEFKQLQVLRGNRNLGSIPERGISRRLLEPVRPELLLRRPVGSVMDEAFPTVSEDFPVERIIPLLQQTQAAITTKRGKITGILTKTT